MSALTISSRGTLAKQGDDHDVNILALHDPRVHEWFRAQLTLPGSIFEREKKKQGNGIRNAETRFRDISAVVAKKILFLRTNTAMQFSILAVARLIPLHQMKASAP